jgi:hypothetical protein
MKSATIIIFFLLSVAVVVSAQSQQGCYPGYFPSSDFSMVCSNPACPEPDAPFLCKLPANLPFGAICLTLDEYINGHPECQGGCLDLRMCGTNKCNETCSYNECEAALTRGFMCPPPNSEPQRHYICTAGPLQNSCGMDRQCSDGFKCFVENPSCNKCCDFAASCPQYETCRGIQCPQSACDTRSVCSWEDPFYCLSGALYNGCSNDPTFFPQYECPNCCDLTTCYPFSCGKCPPEMCVNGLATQCKSNSTPVVCLNASTPSMQNVCMPYGFWPTHPDSGCTNCCSCA